MVHLLFLIWCLLAGVPSDLWLEYKAVATCESRLVTDAIGDNGSAKGIMQIHYYLWLDWAIDESLVKDKNHWTNPIDNIQLAYLIQEKYSIPRNRDRWEQWSAKPTYRC